MTGEPYGIEPDGPEVAEYRAMVALLGLQVAASRDASVWNPPHTMMIVVWSQGPSPIA